MVNLTHYPCNYPVDTSTRLVAFFTYKYTYRCIHLVRLDPGVAERVAHHPVSPIAVIGRGHIGKFLENLARPLVVTDSLSAAYTEMSADKARDAEADDWCESLADNGPDAAW